MLNNLVRDNSQSRSASETSDTRVTTDIAPDIPVVPPSDAITELSNVDLPSSSDDDGIDGNDSGDTSTTEGPPNDTLDGPSTDTGASSAKKPSGRSSIRAGILHHVLTLVGNGDKLRYGVAVTGIDLDRALSRHRRL